MTRARQVLFIQGGGAGVHDDWDRALADGLRDALGAGWEVRYPRMPGEDDPRYALWSAAIRGELADLGDGAIVAGHSVGATILVNVLAERPPPATLGGIVLIAAPFAGDGGWPTDGFTPPADLGAALPDGVPVLVYHGDDDDEVPSSHAALYARAIPQAQVRLLPGRDHQLGGDLSVVAAALRGPAGGGAATLGR